MSDTCVFDRLTWSVGKLCLSITYNKIAWIAGGFVKNAAYCENSSCELAPSLPSNGNHVNSGVEFGNFAIPKGSGWEWVIVVQ